MLLLKDKVIVIAGGTTGIGAAAAIESARQGAKAVVVSGRREDVGKDLCNLINSRFGSENKEGSSGTEAVYTYLDVTDEKTVEALFASTVARFGRVDGVFNNAGVAMSSSPLENVTVEDFEKLYKTNATGMFSVTKHAFATFKKQIESDEESASSEDEGLAAEHVFTRAKTDDATLKSLGKEYEHVKKGLEETEKRSRKKDYSIVNCSSLATKTSITGILPYASVKHAVNGMTKIAAFEGAPFNIRVNAVCPGIINTPIWQDGLVGMVNSGNKSPMGRIGSAEETAKPVVFLLSEYASYVTGTEMEIDGGSAL